MSRRLSIAAKQEQRKPRVRFPDELVFLDSIKENDLKACNAMLRKASLTLDINGLNNAGLTPLHQAVLEGNINAVLLLCSHGADVNRPDSDTWTPLHAACAEGHADIVRLLLHKGAKKEVKTVEGERPLDLIDAADLQTIGAMLESDASRAARMAEESTSFSPEEDSKKNSKGKDEKGGKGKKPKKKPKKKADSDSSSSSDSE
ncbi:protein phosphatase 1 regulatory subunit 27-like [Littorina saxatilis]|uniref:Uncharacterized protein n=1 Tax=Littorina saxatilis TaxID=31220 RepID=A0AAN9BED8_9CAEN